MEITTETIEGSRFGGVPVADNGASPYSPTDLSNNISEISFIVKYFCKVPTKSKKTREKLVESLVEMLTEINEQMTLYIEDLKQSKCIEPFCVSSDTCGEEMFWNQIDMIYKEIRHDEAYELLNDNIIRFHSLLAEADYAKQHCDPIVFKKFFFRKKQDYCKECAVKHFNRQLYKHKPITPDKLREMQVQAVIKALNIGIFDFADNPSRQEVNKISPELMTDLLPCDFEITEEFKKTYTKFRRYAEKNGAMLMFNYEKYGQYILDNFDQLCEGQLYAIFELDNMLYLIHEEMVKLEPELAKYLNKSDDTNTFGIINSLTRLMQQAWFKVFRTDKKYDNAWVEKFVAELLESEHRQELLDIWQDADKRLTLKGNIIGCLNKAGVIDGSDLSIAAAIMQGQEKDNKTFASYMGRGRKRPFFDWICEYVNR